MDRPSQPGDEFFATLRERFTFGLEQDRTDREEAQEDVRFASGGLNQWDPKVVKARKKRPVLTENRLGPSIAQVVNDGRQNKPSVLCSAMDGGTEKTAEYFQGRIRQLEYECDADIAYDTSREHQVTCGRGFYRVTTRYRGRGSEEQYISIEPIENQFSVIWDPAARRYDLDDADWVFVIRTMSRDQHERDFGSDTLASKQNFFLDGDNPAPGWMGIGTAGNLVQVADYYYRDYDDLDDDGEPTVRVCVTNGIEKLDETTWIGSTIPVIPLWGKQIVVDDEKRTYSLIRQAKDPQKLVNLYVSNIAEQISQMPKTPYMVAEGQIAGRESEWETINDVQRAVVQYKTRSTSGDPAGPPQRVVNEPPIQALVTGYLQAIDAVKATMGIFDASLGAGPGNAPGIAIHYRQGESDIANFHFADNEARSRKKLGRILLEIIPAIDGEQPAEKPVRDPAGKVSLVKINQPHLDGKSGELVHHNLHVGRYEVAVATGPSFPSQRREENDRQGEIIKAAPELLWVLGDLYFSTSDGPGADQMAERMQRAIALKSPGLIDADQGDPRQALQQAQQQAQTLHQQNQQLVAEVHKLAQILETRQAEADSRFQVEALKSWTQLRVAEIGIASKTGMAAADREGAQLEQMFNQAHEVGLSAMQHAHTVLQNQHAQDAQMDQADPAQADPGAPSGVTPAPVIPPRQPQF
jgi:hypothetical protein